MKKYILITLVLIIASAFLILEFGTGTLSNLFMNKHSFEDLVERFENEDRENWQKPDEVIALLGNIRDKTIMDIGAGTGYYSFRMSKKGAFVIAADVDDRFLEYINSKKEKLSDGLIQTRKVEYDNPLLSNEEVDHAIIVNTYHHINKRVKYFSKVGKGIKKGGSLMVVDFKKDSGSSGPPKRYRVSAEKVSNELTDAGFKSISVNDTLLNNFYIVIANK